MRAPLVGPRGVFSRSGGGPLAPLAGRLLWASHPVAFGNPGALPSDTDLRSGSRKCCTPVGASSADIGRTCGLNALVALLTTLLCSLTRSRGRRAERYTGQMALSCTNAGKECLRTMGRCGDAARVCLRRRQERATRTEGIPRRLYVGPLLSSLAPQVSRSGTGSLVGLVVRTRRPSRRRVPERCGLEPWTQPNHLPGNSLERGRPTLA